MATQRDSACPAQSDFDPLSPTYLADPLAVFESLRDTPVFYAPSIDYYVVTRHVDIEAIFLDEQTYSAAPTQLPLVEIVPEVTKILLAGGLKPQPSMVSLDPPGIHDSVRRRREPSRRDEWPTWSRGSVSSSMSC